MLSFFIFPFPPLHNSFKSGDCLAPRRRKHLGCSIWNCKDLHRSWLVGQSLWATMESTNSRDSRPLLPAAPTSQPERHFSPAFARTALSEHISAELYVPPAFSLFHSGLFPCVHVWSVTQSCLTLETPWTIAHQAPLSMGFPRQEYWSGLPFSLLQGNFPTQGLNPRLLRWQAGSLPLSHQGRPSGLFRPL